MTSPRDTFPHETFPHETFPQQTFPHEIYPASSAGPAWPPLPPAPGFDQPRPYPSGPRVAVGILQALASAFVGCGWLYFVGLFWVFRVDLQAGSPPFWVILGGIGAVIALSGLGGIGTAATARRPIRDRWVRIWISMSCLFGGLPVTVVAGYLVWTQVFPA